VSECVCVSEFVSECVLECMCVMLVFVVVHAKMMHECVFVSDNTRAHMD
jgi:hypothetical protein